MSLFMQDAAQLLGFSKAYGEGDDFLVDDRKPTDSELIAIQEKAQELEAAYNSQDWLRGRISEYKLKTPYEQIEMISDGTYDAWYAGVKSRWPKPEEA